jgi:hypothetical protein
VEIERGCLYVLRRLDSCETSSEALGNKPRAHTADVPNAPDPHSGNTSAATNPSKAGPSPIDGGGCRTTFPVPVAESPKIGEAWEEVSVAKRTSRDRVKLVVTLPASFATGAIASTFTRSYAGISPPTAANGDKRGLDDNSRDALSSETAAGDKRSALDASDTDDDDGCGEQGGGAGAAGPNPGPAGTRNKKLRRDGEARNLSRERSARQ